jgi:uncharacterized protein
VQLWWLYPIIGAIVGFLAGLLGIGGGMIMVPMLVFVFTAAGLPPQHLMHYALATAMATIVFTSLSNVYAHHRRGGVDWRAALGIAPGIIAGSLGAALGAGFIPTRPLAICFTALMFFASAQMYMKFSPEPERRLPGPLGLFGAGAVIGAISSVLAAGGAFLSIPYLVRRNVPMRRAIGTAAAIGFPIAVAGTLGYVLHGLQSPGLPAGSFGFIYLPALGFVAVTSMLTAPLGARLAHRMPVKRLRAVFSLLLLALAVRMLANLW